jgi:ATP-dependent protease ClpP protease subunit
MSVRRLPELRRPAQVQGTTPELPEKALKSWNPRVRAAASGATITIFDVIGEDFFGEGVSPNRISAALRSIGDKPVTVQINSPGGLYDDGLAIYNLLRLHPAKVTTQVVGMAASAASVIAMAGDEIQVAKAGHLMIHNTQWVAIGDRHVMLEAAEAMATFDTTAVQLYADRSGLDPKVIARMMDEETFMSGEEAVELGFADALLGVDTTQDDTLSNRSALYRVEAALAAGRAMPRAERRKLLREITEDMPGAVSGNPTPGAGDQAVEEDDGFTSLRLAAARLSLVRP